MLRNVFRITMYNDVMPSMSFTIGASSLSPPSRMRRQERVPRGKEKGAMREKKAHGRQRPGLCPTSMCRALVGRENVDGIAFHWYSGDSFDNVRAVHTKHPQALLVNSEATCARGRGRGPPSCAQCLEGFGECSLSFFF